MHGEKVVVLGASDDPSRYAYKAFKNLQAAGYQVIPVNPRITNIEDIPVLPTLSATTGGGAVDTVTVYLRPSVSAALEDELLALKPRRVIFNPGAENAELADRLREAGIEIENACTLVLLSTGQF